MVIVWSNPARADLRAIHDYIAKDSRHYAKRVVQDLMAKVDLLLTAPRMGRVVPEIGEDNVRELGLYSYRILYELIGCASGSSAAPTAVHIQGVVHRRRDFKAEDLPR